MNKAIQRIKNAALANASPAEKRSKVVLDTDQDELDVTEMLIKHGYGDDLVATTYKNRWCRWDVEGEGIKVEVKTRKYQKPEWTTWVIDQYKVDYLMENHADDKLYMVNIFEGKYHLYDIPYIHKCEVRLDYCPYEKRKKPFYHIPKDGWIIELASGTKNKKDAKK